MAIYHVVPLNDTEEHSDSDCDCLPKLEVLDNGNMVLIHHAFDCRVAVELANEILQVKPYDSKGWIVLTIE